MHRDGTKRLTVYLFPSPSPLPFFSPSPSFFIPLPTVFASPSSFSPHPSNAQCLEVASDEWRPQVWGGGGVANSLDGYKSVTGTGEEEEGRRRREERRRRKGKRNHRSQSPPVTNMGGLSWIGLDRVGIGFTTAATIDEGKARRGCRWKKGREGGSQRSHPPFPPTYSLPSNSSRSISFHLTSPSPALFPFLPFFRTPAPCPRFEHFIIS